MICSVKTSGEFKSTTDLNPLAIMNSLPAESQLGFKRRRYRISRRVLGYIALCWCILECGQHLRLPSPPDVTHLGYSPSISNHSEPLLFPATAQFMPCKLITFDSRHSARQSDIARLVTPVGQPPYLPHTQVIHHPPSLLHKFGPSITTASCSNLGRFLCPSCPIDKMPEFTYKSCGVNRDVSVTSLNNHKGY